MSSGEIYQVPTLSAQSKDCGSLFSMWQHFDRDGVRVVFDFTSCTFIRPRAVAFLGGLIRLIESRGGVVFIDWDTMSSAVSMNLAQNGFKQAFGGGATPWQGNSIPYLEHRESEPKTFAEFVQRTWLDRGWLGVSDQLAQALTSSVGEIYVNVFEHADSAVGIHCCGQYYPNLKELSLTLIDFGVGIPTSVRRYLKTSGSPTWSSDAKCLEWAFRPGTSTRAGGLSGGLGLDNLCDFVKATRGSLEIYSRGGQGVLRKGLMRYDNRADDFGGTMITIRVPCDDRYYVLGSEIALLNPF
tara:strand:+ start:293 stop:1186 length:894 start_codon:yes stop_codon:yes gene_type:complete